MEKRQRVLFAIAIMAVFCVGVVVVISPNLIAMAKTMAMGLGIIVVIGTALYFLTPASESEGRAGGLSRQFFLCVISAILGMVVAFLNVRGRKWDSDLYIRIAPEIVITAFGTFAAIKEYRKRPLQENPQDESFLKLR